MTHDEIVAAITVLRPGARWSLRGETIDGLEWLDEIQQKPSLVELKAVVLPKVESYETRLTALEAEITAIKNQTPR